ncbi:DedA family protein [Psittacicella hinzii]|uniref:VTT domain-containing protein n=1 Tax=Psittacicella hinzii TaxID=2028575 RepID=A0A3A1YJ85_9GAMM|nr:DedA family protein [Psittacicella hinzii]RIY37110.1 hypothetical protein CKF58_05285 [Psittacicella hinzii]
MDSIIAIFEHYAEYGNIISYLLVFTILLISGLGVPIPEDITLVTAGILASQGYAHGFGIFFVCMAGVLIGDSCMYALGYIYGVKLLRVKFLRKILTAKRIQTIRLRFQDNAVTFLFIARFLPGLRAAIYLFSGITRKVSYFKFFAIDFFASIISVPVWVSIGYFFGNNLEHLKHLVHRIGLGFSIGAVIVLVALIIFIRHNIKKRRIAAQEEKDQQTSKHEDSEELYSHARTHAEQIRNSNLKKQEPRVSSQATNKGSS